MQYRMLAIPATGSPEQEDELNRFLRSTRVVSVQKTLESWDGQPRWCFCVEYMDGPFPGDRKAGGKASRVDYKEVLSEEDFAIFVRLREVRKRLAAEESIPVYAVCTNAQLAEMAKRRTSSLSAIMEIDGIGESKAGKYGEALVNAVTQPGIDDETGKQPD